MTGKPGWKTSEFWVTLAVVVSPILNGLGIPIEAGVTETFVAGAYALGRSLYKAFKK